MDDGRIIICVIILLDGKHENNLVDEKSENNFTRRQT